VAETNKTTDLESLQGEVERLTGLLEERTDSLRAMTKEAARLRRALNMAGDALHKAGKVPADRIIQTALLTKATEDPELERLRDLLTRIAITGDFRLALSEAPLVAPPKQDDVPARRPCPCMANEACISEKLDATWYCRRTSTRT
jgi:hypothetical protein